MTAADNLVLYYFNAAGRADFIRAAFFIGGVKFEDKRVTQEEWATFKPKTPFGVLPALQIGEKIIGESLAIARYAAARSGLLPASLEDQAMMDSLMQSFASMFDGMFMVAKQNPHLEAEEKAKILKSFVEEKVIPQWKLIEKFMPDTPSGLYFGEKLTIADLNTYNCINLAKALERYGFPKADFLDQLPRTMKCYEAVCKHPKMVEYVEYKKSKNFE